VTQSQLRQLSAVLGGGAVLFGIAPLAFPTFFGRLLGIAASDNRSVATAIRSVGVRDLVIGLGLLQASRRGDDGDLRQWLIARTASDAGDLFGVCVAVLQGERDPRFLALGGLAAAATALGAVLCRAAR
jgi:hypothetical protein